MLQRIGLNSNKNLLTLLKSAILPDKTCDDSMHCIRFCVLRGCRVIGGEFGRAVHAPFDIVYRWNAGLGVLDRGGPHRE